MGNALPQAHVQVDQLRFYRFLRRDDQGRLADARAQPGQETQTHGHLPRVFIGQLVPKELVRAEAHAGFRRAEDEYWRQTGVEREEALLLDRVPQARRDAREGRRRPALDGAKALELRLQVLHGPGAAALDGAADAARAQGDPGLLLGGRHFCFANRSRRCDDWT